MSKRSGGTPGKKRPAPSARRRSAGDLQARIARELYTVLERLGADPELLAVVGSWRDTLDDTDVLAMLKEYNRTGRVLHHPANPPDIVLRSSPA
jgi:hypothetical protein